jgi:hypothetical protein
MPSKFTALAEIVPVIAVVKPQAAGDAPPTPIPHQLKG